jgi:AraC family transcriptional activator of pobA
MRVMTYPQELMEQSPLWDSDYAIRFYRNQALGCRKDDNILNLHWHDSYEIIDVIHGQAVFHIDSRPYEAQAGDLLFIPSGALHVGYSMADENLEYVAIVYHPSFMRLTLPNTAQETYIEPFLDGRAQLPTLLSVEDPSSDLYRRLIRAITAENEQQNVAYQLIVKYNFQLLYAHLSRRYLPASLTEYPVPARYNDSFKPLIQYIEANISNPLSVTQAARMVNLNPYHFCRTFKKLTGRTFVDFVNGCRVNEADRLLRESAWNVTEIAERIGCGNANYFTKLYKKYKGYPPSKSRTINR